MFAAIEFEWAHFHEYNRMEKPGPIVTFSDFAETIFIDFESIAKRKAIRKFQKKARTILKL